MATKANKGSTYYRVGSQNQQILAKYCGTGKTFTLEGLTEKLNAMSPGATISELRDNGFNLRYFHPSTILISWNHWIPTYVREAIKKKTNKEIDGLGNIIMDEKKVPEMFNKKEEPTKQKSIYSDFQGLLPTQKQNYESGDIKPESKPKVSYKSIDSYKPTGSFVFNQDFFNKK